MLSRALTRRGLHARWSRSSALLLSSSFPVLATVFSPLLSHRGPLTVPPRRSLIIFPTTPNLPDGGAEFDEYEEQRDEQEADEDDDSLHELHQREREPSKAERLKLKEKEKRRQKMAMRERTDGKRRKDSWKQEQKPPKLKKRNEWEDIAPAEDDADAADVIDGEVIGRPRLRRNGRGAALMEEEEEGEEEEEDEDEEPLDPRPLNSAIKSDPIVLVDGNGKRIGLVSLQAALAKAREAELDILQLSPPRVSPAVCRVVNYVDFIRAEDAKRRKAGLPSLLSPERKVKRIVKTVQMRKSIDPHDLQHKIRVMRDWLSRGFQVRLMYFEKEIVKEDQLALFDKVAALLQGAGVWLNNNNGSNGSNDSSSAAAEDESPVVEKGAKPVAVFDPVKKEAETTGGKKDKKQAKADKKQQQPRAEQAADGATVVNGTTVVMEPQPAPAAAVPSAATVKADVQEQGEAEATAISTTKRQKGSKKQQKQQLSTG